MRFAEGSIIAERFVLEAPAGSGGMAEVWRASDRTTGDTVALKILRVNDEEMTARFEREAVVLAKLRHPRLVRYVDHGREPDGQHWIAMEWLDGETLVQRLRRQPPSVSESIALGRGVAEALAAVHAKGMIHRDVKPSNIFLVDRRVEGVKLLDFGIARWIQQNDDLTGTGARIGTFAYMSPEQAWGRRDLGPATDVFSLGCTLFASLTGKKPFAAKHSTAVLAKILLAEIPRVSFHRPELPAEVDELIAHMMEREVSARLADGAAVLRELKALSVLAVGRPSAPMAEHLEALTATERQVVTLVLAGGLAIAEESTGLGAEVSREAPTVVDGEVDVVQLELRGAAQDHGARLDSLADGTLIASFTTIGGPTEHALKAASFALRVAVVAPAAPIALGTGFAALRGGVPYGDVIDRAVHALRRARPGEIAVDDVSGGLLGTRFELGGDDGGLLLLRERALGSGRRKLLGRESPFVGRRRELKTLEAVYEECAEEEVARAVLVTAPAGAGKSRLRQELVVRLEAEHPSPALLIARADPLSAGSPLGLLADAVRRTAGISDGEAKGLKHHRLRARLARVLSHDDPALERCAVFLGELTGAPAPSTPLEPELAAARADPRLMGDQMSAAFEVWLTAETRTRPVVFILEDLQWGDSSSVAFLDSTLRNLAERPLLLVALARPEVHERFVELWASRDLTELRLPALTKKAASSLVRAFLGDDAPQARVDRLVDLAQGNAFYLEELIRHVAGGSLEPEAALPPTVLAMVQARLAALPEEGRRTLRAASVFGMRFWHGGLLALLGGGDRTLALDAWLSDLEAHELISPRADSRFPDERELSFPHALLREGAYAMLTKEDRARGHRLAAEWLTDAGEADHYVLATHHERGGDRVGAAPHLVAAAMQALEANDLDGCIELAGRAAADGIAPALTGHAMLVSAEAHRWRGEAAEALRCAQAASDRLEEGSALWYRAFTELLVAAFNRGRPELAGAALDRATRVRPQPGAFVARATTICRGLGILLEQDRFDDAWTEVQAAADAEQAAPTLVAWVRVTQSALALYAGDFGTSARQRAAAVSAFERAGNQRQACTQRMNEGHAQVLVGRYARAETLLREASETAERLGLKQTAAWAQHNLGFVLHRLGKHAEGLELEELALARGEAQDNNILRGVCHLYLGTMHFELDEPERALVHAAQAVELFEKTPRARVYARARLARIHVVLGADDEAVREAELAMAGYEKHGIDESECVVYLALAESLDAAGRHEEAKAVTVRGQRRLVEAAQRITDPSLRRSFLENVLDHARLAAR